MENYYVLIPLAPLIGAILAGFFGKVIGRSGSHIATIAGVAVAFVLSAITLYRLSTGQAEVYNDSVYVWAVVDGIRFEVGFLVDNLTAMMMCVVTFVSLMVHIYTIGYMHEDPGYQRFFSYIALFTFSMLMLVMSNNFMQLFFGWEAVGLVSYLLIGFWYKKESAIFANLKAFLVNRVGDFGFLLGIAGVLMYFGSLDYATVFGNLSAIKGETIALWGDTSFSAITVICILLFIGAMGKSAQVPLHVWLPDSMEGPTPISALIHAATMVTAGIFMVARMSPLFELSEAALTFVLVIGATTALFMGLIGIVQNDIKRVVAYSTLSQLGYMVVALGVSAYTAGVYHLMTHAFFKALLFLAAGSVIIAMHHEQDMRKMGGLKKYMPITYWTSLIGSLALIGFPFTSGYYSKDSIILAVEESTRAGATYAYFCVMAGVFVTAFYSFRMFFNVFHGKERMDHHTKSHLHECPPVVTVPLVLLAIPSVIIGLLTVGHMVFGPYFDGVISVKGENDVLALVGEHFHGWFAFGLHFWKSLPFWLAMSGVASAAFLYLKRPDLAELLKKKLIVLHRILDNKYGFDVFNQKVFAGGSRALGKFLWQYADVKVIDGAMVNGTAKSVGMLAAVVRHIQTGYVYHYAFAMIAGLVVIGFIVLN